MATRRTKITDVPAKLLINNVLPFCEGRDVLSLGCTNKFFALVTNDDTFWRLKLAVDYNFTGSETARASGWKFIYRRLRNPRAFVWGAKDSGRLGLSQFPQPTFSDVPFPVELHLPGVRAVSLAMSNESPHILGADGNVYVCGVLGSQYDLPPKHEGFSESRATTWTPLKLQLPAPTRSISCHGHCAMTLDPNSTVWSFASWGRPFRLISPFLDCSSPETTPAQVECGWSHSTVLMKSGDVCAWWPFETTPKGWYWKGMVKLDKDESTRAIIPNGGTVIPCHAWEINMDPVMLPALPDLPDLPETGLPEEECTKETKLTKIASFCSCLIGLTNKGHVLMSDGMGREDFNRTWRYLPSYSEIGKVKEHAAFRTIVDDNGKERPSEVELSSDTMLITHISAHFYSFFAYSSSIVLKGDYLTTPETLPTIIPELQNRSVISVVIGDFHFGALTSTGKLLTWGDYSDGALGLGDPKKLPVGSPGGFKDEEGRAQLQKPPPPVTVPSEVRFDHGLTAEGRVKRYCFAAAAGENCTAALVEDEVPPEGLK